MKIKEEVISLLHKVLALKEQSPPSGTNETEILGFAIQNNLDVPPDLKAWLCVCNGSYIGGGLFGVHTLERWLDVDSFYELYPSWKKQGWIPIAGDGCGNYYVLGKHSCTVSGHPVFFIDTHEDADCLAYVVASGLWQFLRFVLRQEIGEDYWPFNKQKVLEQDPMIEKCQEALLPWEYSS